MGLFTTRRRHVIAARDCWQPSGSGVGTVPGYDMDDDGCAGEHAYAVTFTMGLVPDATITAWSYAIYAAPDAPGDFQIGWRCEYHFGAGPDSAPWAHVIYGCDDPEFYDDLGRAETTARQWAETLASTPRTGPSDPLADEPGFFDWDGVPW